jgi:hypothetical protein
MGEILKESDSLTDFMFVVYKFQFLSAAVELDLFTLLSREPGLTRDQIASRLGLQENPIRLLLMGCGSVGLLKKEGERYFNSPAANAALSKDSPMNAVAAIRFVQHITYRPMSRFCEALQANTNVGLQEIPGTAPNLYMRLSENPQLEAIFLEMMSGFSAQGAAALVNTGAINAIALAQRFPSLRVTILDLPTVAPQANARIKSAGLSARVKAVGHDVFGAEFPKECDAILFSRFLGIWSAEAYRGFLARAHRALDPGGTVFILEPISDDDEMGPLWTAHLGAYIFALVSGQGIPRTWAEVKGWLEEAGFKSTSRQPLPGTPETIMQGTKP